MTHSPIGKLNIRLLIHDSSDPLSTWPRDPWHDPLTHLSCVVFRVRRSVYHLSPCVPLLGQSFRPTSSYFLLLLLSCYVPNVAKRSIWDQCKKKYILTTDRRPTTSHLGKFQMAISPRGVVRSTPCLVLRWGFRGRRIEWRYFRFDQIQ